MKLNTLTYTAYFALFLFFTSCSVGKRYSQPLLDEPSMYKQQISVTGEQMLLPWNTFFKDPQLIVLIEEALEKNKSVVIALKTLEQLEISHLQAKKGLQPQLHLVMDASRAYQSKKTINSMISESLAAKNYTDHLNASLALSWEADIWGKVKEQRESAQATFLMQKENVDALKSQIIVQVAQAYFNLMLLDEQLKIVERNIDLSQKTLEIMQLQYRSNQVNSMMIEQVMAQKKTAELLLPLTKQHLEIQENALSLLTGNYPKAINRNTQFTSIDFPTDLLVGIPMELLSRRADLRSAEYALISANATTNLAKIAMYPSFSLQPSLQINSNKLTQWFNLPGALISTIAGNMTQPLLNKKILKTNYKLSQLEQEKVVEQFKFAMMTAVSEVSDAMIKVQAADERLQLSQQKQASLQKATQQALLLYKSGFSTYLDVLSSQSNALENDIETIEIYREQYRSFTELYRALGGGLE